MELEFDVRITANVLYDYMLRHTYYSMSGLIGTIVGALMFVCFFFRGDVIFLIAGRFGLSRGGRCLVLLHFRNRFIIK